MPAPRPRGFTGSSGSSGGRPAPNTPMSERQQMALLMQMTSSSSSPNSSNTEMSPTSSSSTHGPARSRDRNERGETALHVAAIKGDQDAVKKLLDSGMSPNVADFAGWTPLHEACNHAHYNVALTLVKSGANVNVKGLDDDTPLHDAAVVGHLKLVKMLVEKGADVNAKNRKGKTPVDIASPSVQSYLMSIRDSAPLSTGGRPSQQTKKIPNTSSASPSSSCTTSATLQSSTSLGISVHSSPSSCEQKKSSLVATTTSNTDETNEPENSNNTMHLSASNKKDDEEEEDIYEFKATPKDSTSAMNEDNKIDLHKNDKQLTSSISDEKSTNIDETTTTNNSSTHTHSSSPSSSVSGNNNNPTTCGTSSGPTKRSHSDVEGMDENTDNDEIKKKKRKETENVKDLMIKQSSSGRLPQRQEKSLKHSTASGKLIGGIASKVTTTLERKSPVASPKPVTSSSGSNLNVSVSVSTATNKVTPTTTTTDSDTETDDNKNTENFTSNGLKVPPLKIVIPQQTANNDMETGSRNGKNNSNRVHAALPYVVASSSSSSSSSNSNDSLQVEKENPSSRCTSPIESGATGSGKTGSNNNVTTSGASGNQTASEEKNSKATSEERAQQRVLRSSNRSGGQSVDRGSNNSSPQLQSSSPSPAPTNSTNTDTNDNSSSVKNANISTSSPANQTQNQSDTTENVANVPSPSASSTSSSKETQNNVELHPRKRKIRAKQEDNNKASTANTSSSTSASTSQPNIESSSVLSEIHPHDHPFTNCYQMFLNIRKQIDRKHRSLLPIQPRPPQGFKDYLMNRRTYVLAGRTPSEPVIVYPANLPAQMKELFTTQEKERHKLRIQHVVEKEKLGLTVEQEILRVHGKAARSLACQSLPLSACTIMKDDEVYNMITPEQEEKDRNARSRYNGRLFLSWLQDVDDKWEKIKESMVLRHHNEAESLHAVQKMDWEWLMKEHLLCDFNTQPVIDESHVPIVPVNDDFDLLPA